MPRKQLILLVSTFLFCSAYSHTCKAGATEDCLEDHVQLLQRGIGWSTQSDPEAVRGRMLVPQGMVHHRYAHLAKNNELMGANKALLLNCTNAHGDLGTGYCIDVNGRACNLCGQPGPMFPEYADGFIVRDDCGNQTVALVLDSDRPLVAYNNPPSANFLPPKTGPPNSWTNAWCETNSQKSCADADANRDYFYYAAGFVVGPGFEYDFYYCKYNGYLEPAFVKNMRNYDLLYEQAAAVCAARDREFNVSSITARQMLEVYQPDIGPPNPWQARWLGAWTCAMGGPGGDMSYCAYTYKDLGDDRFCQYPSGPGFKGTIYEGTPEAKRWECPKNS